MSYFHICLSWLLKHEMCMFSLHRRFFFWPLKHNRKQVKRIGLIFVYACLISEFTIIVFGHREINLYPEYFATNPEKQ